MRTHQPEKVTITFEGSLILLSTESKSLTVFYTMETEK